MLAWCSNWDKRYPLTKTEPICWVNKRTTRMSTVYRRRTGRAYRRKRANSIILSGLRSNAGRLRARLLWGRKVLWNITRSVLKENLLSIVSSFLTNWYVHRRIKSTTGWLSLIRLRRRLDLLKAWQRTNNIRKRKSYSCKTWSKTTSIKL